jgi:hypothetical protein
VTRDTNFGIFETRAQVGLRTPDRLQKGGLAAARPCCRSGVRSVILRPFADAVLREEVSSRKSPDISSGMTVGPTETKPTFSRRDTQGRRLISPRTARRWFLSTLDARRNWAARLPPLTILAPFFKASAMCASPSCQ